MILSGRNVSVSTSMVDVWEQNTVRTLPSAAVVLGISSGSTDDDGAPVGTGALTLKVEGLDENYNHQEETVTLNGRTEVNTVNSYLRVNKISVVTVGTGGANAGIIYAYDTSDTVTAGVPQTATKIFAQMAVGANVSLQGMYTVPVGKTFTIVQILASIGDSNATARYGRYQLQILPYGGVWETIPLGCTGSGGALNLELKSRIKLDAKTEIRFQAIASDGQADLFAQLMPW
jgi:hypothetical protein